MTDGRLAFLFVAAFLLGTCFGLWFLSYGTPALPYLREYAPAYCARQAHGGAYYHGDISAVIACEPEWRATMESAPPKDAHR